MRTKLLLDFLDIVGEVGRLIFIHDLSHTGARRHYPKCTPTPAQVAARDDWRYVDSTWQVLDQTHKQLWRTWKPWYPQTGYNLYMKVNYPRYRHSQPILDTPPPYPPWVGT
jgi:hypothetical protein